MEPLGSGAGRVREGSPQRAEKRRRIIGGNISIDEDTAMAITKLKLVNDPFPLRTMDDLLKKYANGIVVIRSGTKGVVVVGSTKDGQEQIAFKIDGDEDEEHREIIVESEILKYIDSKRQQDGALPFQKYRDSFRIYASAEKWADLVSKSGGGSQMEWSAIFEESPGVSTKRFFFILATEYIRSITVGELFETIIKWDDYTILMMVLYKQICESLRKLHDMGIFHGDLHLDNILIVEPKFKERVSTVANDDPTRKIAETRAWFRDDYLDQLKIPKRDVIIDFGASCFLFKDSQSSSTGRCSDERFAFVHKVRELAPGEPTVTIDGYDAHYEWHPISGDDFVGRIYYDNYVLASSLLWTLKSASPSFLLRLKRPFVDMVRVQKDLFLGWHRTRYGDTDLSVPETELNARYLSSNFDKLFDDKLLSFFSEATDLNSKETAENALTHLLSTPVFSQSTWAFLKRVGDFEWVRINTPVE